MNQVKSNEPAEYAVASDDAIIAQALAILQSRYQPGALMGSPSEVKAFLTLRAAGHDREVFGCL